MYNYDAAQIISRYDSVSATPDWVEGKENVYPLRKHSFLYTILTMLHI